MSNLITTIGSHHVNLSPSKVARKYEYLTENPFRFFRGTNALFYEDLASSDISASPFTWICGDLHLENFGSYKGDNRLVYFDLNDFDEAILAPVLWEVLRMATSILVGFDALKITNRQALKAVSLFLNTYAETLAAGKPRYIESRTAKGIVKSFLNKVESRPLTQLLEKRTLAKKGVLQLNNKHKKHLAIDKTLKGELTEAFNVWMNSNNQPPNDYNVLDAGFHLAGTGSLGVRRYIFLIQKNSNRRKHMFIDMKEALPSSLVTLVNCTSPVWVSEAERIIYVQKVMQNVPPAQLSTLNFKDRDYVLQEVQPSKDRIDFKMIEDALGDVCLVIKEMAMLSASAHLRAVGRKGSCTADELIEFGTKKHWQQEVKEYALKYKTKVLRDYSEFCNHINDNNKAKKKNSKSS